MSRRPAPASRGAAAGRHGAAGTVPDAGSMAVEIVLLMPVLLLFTLLVVACGRYVDIRAEVDSASRDAVRAASLERTAGTAQAAAVSTASGAVPAGARCAPAQLLGQFVAGATITVRLQCTVDYSGLGLIGVPGSAQLVGTSSAPLDRYRRTG